MAEKIACGYFLLLRNKKTDLYGRGPRMAHMAEKIACGYFLLLHNKKRISKAVGRGRPTGPKK